MKLIALSDKDLALIERWYSVSARESASGSDEPEFLPLLAKLGILIDDADAYHLENKE